MVDLTELDGVGAARRGYLQEAGYDDFESIAEADHEELAEDIDVPEDTALELVVQSQNLVAEEDDDVEEEEEMQTISDELEDLTEDEDDDDEDVSEDGDVEKVVEDEDTGPGVQTEDGIRFTVTFEGGLSHDTFFDAVMRQRLDMYKRNITGVEAFDHALEEMRHDAGNSITLTMNPFQLNNLHNSVKQRMISYKGNNLIDEMDALDDIMEQIEEVREEHVR